MGRQWNPTVSNDYSAKDEGRLKHAESTPNLFAVAGGVPVRPHEFPFMPAFYHKSNSWTGGCAGALISPRHIITVWHCFRDKDSKFTQVGFHKTDRDDEEGVVKKQVQRFVFHPVLDVGILVLKSNVEGIQPIHLPEDDGCDYNGQIVTLVGPGPVDDKGTIPDSLFMKVDLVAYTGNGTAKRGPQKGEKCINWEGRKFVCATSLQKNPWGSGGSGDSGAPIMICHDGQDGHDRNTGDDCTLIGVLSGGTGSNFKSGSAGPCVSGLRPWIDMVIKETGGNKRNTQSDPSDPSDPSNPSDPSDPSAE